MLTSPRSFWQDPSRCPTRFLTVAALLACTLGSSSSTAFGQSIQILGIQSRTLLSDQTLPIVYGVVTFDVRNNTANPTTPQFDAVDCGPFSTSWDDVNGDPGWVNCLTSTTFLSANSTGTVRLLVPMVPSTSGNIKVRIRTSVPTDSALIHVTVNAFGTSWTADQISFPEVTFTPQIQHGTSATVSAYRRRSSSFTITNIGNGNATFTFVTSCSGSLSNCNFSNATSGAATTTVTLAAGASSTLAAYYTPGVVGSTGQLRITMTAPPRVSGLVEADTSNLTINAADLTAPVLSVGGFGYPISINGFPFLNVTRDTATVTVRAYDLDGLVGTPTLNVNGVALTPVSVSDNPSGMTSDKIWKFLATFLDGGGLVTATVSDGYHISTAQVYYVHDGTPENQPKVTVVTPTYSVPAGFAGVDTFVVANGGHQTLTYSVNLYCYQTTGCGMSSSYASVTIAAGASVRIPVPFAVGAVGSSAYAVLDATYYGSWDSTTASASFTATAVPTAPPTIAVTPTSGTVVTSSPLTVRIDWCDYDDAIASRQVTWQGQTLADVYVPTTRVGCFAAGTSTYSNLAINLWQQSLVASVTDAGGHTVTTTTAITFSPPLSSFAPSVTPTAGWHRLIGPSAVTAADTFTITNNGAYTAAYAVAPLCGGSTTLSSCTANKGSVSLAPEEADIVIVTYTRSGAADVADTLKLAATYTSPLGGIVADTGRKVVVAPSAEVAPVVTPVQALVQVPPSGTVNQAWFTVRNPSTIPETITLNWAASSGWGFMFTSVTPTLTTTLQLAAGETQYGFVNVVTPLTSGVTGTVTLTSSYVTATGQTVSSSASIQLTTGSSTSGGIALSVSGTTQPLLAPNIARTVNFVVQNTSSTQGTVSFTASCPGTAIAWCDAPMPASASLTANSQTTVAVTVHTASAGGQSGTVTLTATSGTVTASGSVAVSTAVGAGPLQIRAVRELNPEATIARDQCLTITAGDDAAYECGDLRLVHALPTTTTMNKARTPTLIYLSAHAHPVTLVATDVTIDGSICPAQIQAIVRIDGISYSASPAWNGTCGQTATRRIVVPVPHASRLTGVYHYSLEVNTTVNGTQYTQTDATGLMAVVNRSEGVASLFGKGWWLDGLEQLFPLPVPPGQPEQIFWVGGDGSTRLYKQQADLNVFLAQSLDRPDTLERLAGNYKRHLRNGAYVLFSLLKHTQTVNAQRHITQFNWNTNNQLTSIILPVPPGSSAAPTYTFNYTGGVLSSVIAPANSNGDRVTTFTRGSDSVAIADPGAPAVRYKSDATNRVVRRTNRLGDATTFDFDVTTSLLAHSKLNMSPEADSIAKTFCAAEGSGRAACASTLADPANVATVYDGPRLPPSFDVADITHFSINRFGAPTKIIDALGHSLTLYRNDASWPFAVTAIENANGHLVQAAYNNRGLIDSTWDTNPLGDGQPAGTRYLWDSTYDKVTQITAPTFEVTRIHYDSNGDREYQEDGRGDTSRTRFAYTPVTRQLATIRIPGNSPAELQAYEYDPILGNLLRETTPLGGITNYRTNAIGQVDSMATQLDGEHERSQQLLYDLRDRLHIQRDIGSAMDSPRGIVPASTLEVTTEYDDEDRTRSVDRKSIPNLANTLSSTTSWTYDAAGRKKSDIEAGGRQQFWIYDPAGNVKSWDAGRGSSALITTTYDALNRPLNRTTPSVTKAAQIGTQAPQTFPICAPHPARFPYFPYIASGTQYDPTIEGGLGTCDGLTDKPNDLVLPGDVATFSYDDVGNLTTANSNDARVTREYYPNGALKHETQIVALLDDSESPSNRFNTHIYRMGYRYDLSGRRLSRTDTLPDCPSCAQTYHYHPVTGFLDAGSDVGAGHNPASLVFGYDAAGRLTSRGINDSTAIFQQHFDPDGRIDFRNVKESSTLIFGDVMSYDKVGHNTGTMVESEKSLLAIPMTNQVYSGLGALAYFSQQRSGVLHEDQYQTDGMTNRISNGRWFDAGQMQQESRYTRERLDAIVPVLTWQSGQSAPPVAFQRADTTTIEYGIAGSVEYTHRAAIRFDEIGGWTRDPANDVWDWNAHGAEERLRMSQHSTMTQFGQRHVTTDYRYDALGRRVAVRTRLANCQDAPPECLPRVEHTVWDGDQVLMERRLTLEEAAAYGNWYGSVRYTHAGGIDEPLIIWKTDVGGLVPHRSWRGVYEAGTRVDGTSGGVTWPGQSFDVFYAPDATVAPVQASHWMGSLIEGKTDASGLQYMRNRYYDPKTGRFTQEDPLGLAGGMNLYGFAGGDPVNFDDPFGLCVWDLCIGEGYATAVAAAGLAALVTAAYVDLTHKFGSPTAWFSKSSTSGETGAAAGGRAAHKTWDPGAGFQKEVRLPSGKRCDALNPETCEIKELKPDNERAKKRGERQLKDYKKELDEQTGKEHKTTLETYKPKQP